MGFTDMTLQDQEPTPYERAYDHVMNGGAISAKAIQEAAGVKRRAVTEIILALAENGVISAPDDEGLRTLLVEKGIEGV
jgi:Mn-dependent DtxR family transcriptional regulator